MAQQYRTVEMATTTAKPQNRIRLTAGLLSSQYDYTTHTAEEALVVMSERFNLYEVTTDDEQNAKFPVHSHVGMLRIYGDIDVYADTEDQAKEHDEKFEKCLRSVLAEYNPAIMCGSGKAKNSAKGKYKISWRFVLPQVASTKEGCRRFCLDVLEDQLLDALKAEGVDLAEVLDKLVYANGKKMRVLGSSKDGENRPLRLVSGSPIDTLITYIPQGCQVITPPPSAVKETKGKKTKTTTTTTTKISKAQKVTERQFQFMEAVAENLPLAILDDYTTTVEFIWAFWNEERSERMMELIQKTCKKSKKYTQPDTAGLSGADWVKSKINQEQTGGKRFGSVIYWLQKANPSTASELFKMFPRVYIDELFGQTLKPTQAIEYDDRYVRPLPIEDFDTIALESALGTGKTIQLMGNKNLGIDGILANKNVYPRVLFVSGRKSFTRFAMGELKEQGIEFRSYDEQHKEALSKINRLFIQVESLWKLNDGFQSYDLLIVDESETIAHQLHSVQTNGEHMIDNHIMFERVVSSATKVIVADAFLSDRSFSIIKELRNPAYSVYIRNSHQPYKRTAFELRATENDNRMPNVGEFIFRIKQAIETKKRIVIVWTSKRKGLAFEKEYLEPLRENLKWKFYHGDSTKEDRADLHDVSTAWKDLDVLMYTTSISVGVSYNPSDEVAQFDELFLWACASSATPRDIAQALLRCRKIKANRLTYVCDLRTMPKQVRGMDALREFVKDKKKRLQAEHPMIQWKTAPQWADENYIYNENEVRVSQSEYKEVLRHYLRWCGYTITEEGGAEQDYTLKNIEGVPFENITTIDFIEAEDIRQKMKRDEADVLERLAYKKYRFMETIKDTHHQRAKDIWNAYMENINDETNFWNLSKEKHTTTERTAIKESQHRYLTMTQKHLEQRTVIDKLLHILGMKHTQEAKIINHADFVRMAEEAKKLEEQVRQVFGIRKSRRKGDVFDAKAFHDMLLTVWDSWSGSIGGAPIQTINEKRVKKDGKLGARMYDYLFTPRDLWECITDREQEENTSEQTKQGYAFVVDV